MEIPEPIIEEATDTYYTGAVLATHNFHYDALPTEMTFDVYGPDGEVMPLTIDTSSGDLLLSSAYIVHYDQETDTLVPPSIASPLFIWQDNVAYELYYSTIFADSQSTWWATIYIVDDRYYYITYEDTIVTIEDVTDVIFPPEELEPEAAPPTNSNAPTNDVTKVVNGPVDANAAMIALTAGSVATFALVTIIRRRK